MGLLSRPTWLVVSLCALSLGGHATSQPLASSFAPSAPESAERITLDPQRTLGLYCATCHSNGRTGLDLDGFVDASTVQRDPAAWEKVLQRLRNREMPPPDRAQPSPEEIDNLNQWIVQSLATTEITANGPLSFRRLQRVEYINSVNDLLNVRLQSDMDFPEDQTTWTAGKKFPAVPAAVLVKYRLLASKVLEKVQTGPSVTQVAMNGLLPESIAVPRQNPLFSQRTSSQSKTAWIRENLGKFARKAYRRSLETYELDHLYGVYQRASRSGQDFENAIKEPLREILTSRHFLYRVEYQSKLSGKLSVRQQYALAARLSYTLWRTTPDRELLKQAEKGTLVKNLEPQVRRLLKNRKSRSFTDEFATQWLGLGALGQNPGMDTPLHHLFRQETEQFVAHVVQFERSLTDFIDADYTFVNDTLARHYGLPSVEGDHLRRVPLQNGQRGGLVTQGSVLAVTSFANETSPVKRGKWILETFLGVRPSAPPPGLGAAFTQRRRSFEPGTGRSRLETHRANTACAACHDKVDPYGFALENYDSLGSWRATEFGLPVDAAAELPNGTRFEGAVGLKAHLRSQQTQFLYCLSDKLLAYSLNGRSKPLDPAAIERLSQKMSKNELNFTQLAIEVIKSDSFQRRRVN